MVDNNELLEELSEVVKKENFTEINEVIKKIRLCQNPFDFIEPMLKLMENNPNIDFGNPGPLVHFMETYYNNGYEELLVQSVKNHPTIHTVWMLNRIINDPNLLNRKKYIDLLLSLREREDIGIDILQEIDIFFKNK